MLRRPDPSEHNVYYRRYIDRVPDENVLEVLERGAAETSSALADVPPERETYRYEPDKWSIREVIGHVVDSERAFAYRALAFARRDPAPYPSFEQDEYAASSNANERPLSDLLREFEAVRSANVRMFRGFTPDAWDRRGIASGFEFSVRTFPYIIAGHEIWHRDVLRERYLDS